MPEESTPEAAVEIAAAHLFGLCLNLRLPRNAQALALGVASRARNAREVGQTTQVDEATLRRISSAADNELRERFDVRVEAARVSRGYTSMDIPLGRLNVDIEPATMSLIRRLRSASATDAVDALDEADRDLDQLQGRQADALPDARLPSGVLVTFERTEPSSSRM